MAEGTSPSQSIRPQVKTFTPSERIAELNQIDQSVSSLLSSAAEAVGLLSNSTTNVESAPKTLASAQARFTKASSTYFSTLSEIEVRLRRQVYALEEAGLIDPGTDKDAKAGRTEGGLGRRNTGGSLDPSWLNARADNGVDFAMRRELVNQAKDFLERNKTEGNPPQDKTADSRSNEDTAET